jgi:excisionase family DNA binding protein
MNSITTTSFPNPPVAVETAEPEHLWTAPEVANYLRVSLKTVFNLRKNGLPFVQLGGAVRFDPKKVREYLSQNHRLSSHRLRQTKRKGATS